MTVKHALSAEVIRMSGRIAFKAREQILALMRDWIGSEQTSWGVDLVRRDGQTFGPYYAINVKERFGRV